MLASYAKARKNFIQNILLNCYHLLTDDKSQVKKPPHFYPKKVQPSRTGCNVEVSQKPDVKVSLHYQCCKRLGKNPSFEKMHWIAKSTLT